MIRVVTLARRSVLPVGTLTALLLSQLTVAGAATPTFAFSSRGVARTCSAGVGTLTVSDTYTESSATDGPHAVALDTAPSNYITYASVQGGSTDTTHFGNVAAGRHTVEWITPAGVITSKIVAVCPSHMTMSAPAYIVYGKTATIKTVLTDAGSHAPIGGVTVRLYRHTISGSTWSYVASTTTTASGVGTLVVSPRSFIEYGWRFAGSATNASTSSPVAVLDVRQVVSIHAPSAVVAPAKATIWGTLTPAVDNTVYLQTQSGTGSAWVTVATGSAFRQTLPNGVTAVGYVFHRTGGVYRVVAPETLRNGRGVSRTIMIGIIVVDRPVR